MLKETSHFKNTTSYELCKSLENFEEYNLYINPA